MIIRLIKKASSQINSSLIKYWVDDYGNVLSIFSVAGKKYGFIGRPKEDPLDWKVFLGVATTKPDSKNPAGSAEYIEGEELSNDSAEELTTFFKQNTVTGGRIPNSSSVAWSPKSEIEKENLIKIIDIFSQINRDLKSHGILYSGGDKLIIGEDVTSKDVSAWNLPKESIKTTPESSSTESKDYSPKSPGEEKKTTTEVKREEPKQDYSKSGERSDHFFGGVKPQWYEGSFNDLGKHHKNRPDHKPGEKFYNWESVHAVDILAPVGTPIYSLTNGKVSSVSSGRGGDKKIFGSQISINGIDGYPNIFYTHTGGVAVSPGDRVRVGDLIAHIGSTPSPDMPSHVHVGLDLPLGSSMAQFMSEDGTLKKEIKRISSRQDFNLIKKISSR